MTLHKTSLKDLIAATLISCSLCIQTLADEINPAPPEQQLTWKEKDWLKHLDASLKYKECLSQESPELGSFVLRDAHPKWRREKLEKLQRFTKDHEDYHEKHTVNKQNPKKLFGRAKKNAELARNILQGVNWSEESQSVKANLVAIQICYLTYHNYLKNETYLGSVERVSRWDRERQQDNIYDWSRYKGASNDAATTLSILGTSSSKGKLKPWSSSPNFFTHYNVKTYGRTIKRDQLLKLDLTVGLLRGLTASCSCLDKITSPSIHAGYCMSVTGKDFAALLDRQEKLLDLLLQAGGTVSPSLITGPKKAKVKVSDFPELQAHLANISPLGQEDYRKARKARKDLAETLLYYWEKDETEALSCTIDAMSPGRSYLIETAVTKS